MPSVTGFEETGSCIVADHPSGKPLYVLSASMTGRLSVSSPIPENGPEQFATLFHVLSYKFALIASFLALDNLDETITKFDQAKKCRNDIVHGDPFDDAALPIAKVRN
jgi:hypothetical protein